MRSTDMKFFRFYGMELPANEDLIAEWTTQRALADFWLVNGSDCQARPSSQLNPIFALVFYSTVFVLSLCGNATVILIMCIRARNKSVTNMLISNLAFSDLCVCLTSLWITPLYWFTGDWTFGVHTCRLFPLFQAFAVCNSSLSLLVMAVDRYFVVCRNDAGKQRSFNLTPKTCGYAIVLIWTIALGIALPSALHMTTESKFKCGEMLTKCNERWTKGWRPIYGVFITLVQFALPLSFIGYSNIQIYLYLRRQCSQSSFRLRVVNTRKGALFRMLLMMVVGFACCWLPMNILNLMRDLDMSNILKPNFNLYFMFSHMLAMVGTCLNPLIYCFLNHSFRDEFTTKFLSKLCPRSRKPKRSPSERVEPDRPPVDRPLLDSRRVSLMKSGNEVHLSQEEVERSATTRLTASQSFPKDKPEEQPELS